MVVCKRSNSVFTAAFEERLDGLLTLGAQPSHLLDALLVTTDASLLALIPDDISLEQIQMYKKNHQRLTHKVSNINELRNFIEDRCCNTTIHIIQ